MVSVRPISRKKSAGPPMPKDVRDASGSFSRIPGRPRSQASLDALRQLIAQLSNVARAHQQQEVVRPDQAFQCLAGALEVADVDPVGELVGKVRSLYSGRVVLAGREHV